jgi:hypothetical protein
MFELSRRAVLAAGLVLPFAARSAEPPRGSALRQVVLDALRPRVERDIGPPVQFLIERINVEGPWAFVSATPQRLNGAPVDWSRTRYARDFAADAMSDMILALLHHEGGAWRVREYALGPTDVTWVEWIPKYRLSERFFMEGAR